MESRSEFQSLTALTIPLAYRDAKKQIVDGCRGGFDRNDHQTDQGRHEITRKLSSDQTAFRRLLRVKSNLAGVFRIGLAHRHVWIFRRIDGILNGWRDRLGRRAK